MESNCDRMARLARHASKIAFARTLRHYIGGSSLVLKGEGQCGEDLVLRGDGLWALANECYFEVRKEYLYARRHVFECRTRSCREADQRFDKVEQLQENGWPLKVALGWIYDNKNQMVLSREKGLGKEIDIFKPFVEWFDVDELVPIESQ